MYLNPFYLSPNYGIKLVSATIDSGVKSIQAFSK